MPEPIRPEDEQDLATLLADLRGPAEPHELAREREYVAAFRAAQASRTDTRPVPRRSMLAQVLAAKSLVAAAAVVSVAGGGAAAAYSGSLPGSLQSAAHRTIGAPAPAASHRPADAGHGKPTATPTGTPGSPSNRPTATPPSDRGRSGAATPGTGPEATGPAAKGLCTAWEKDGLDEGSTAYESLARAAGGPAGIPAFCAAAPEPGPTAKPSTAPSERGKSGDAGRPDDVGGGKPSERPAGASPAPGKGSDRSGR